MKPSLILFILLSVFSVGTSQTIPIYKAADKPVIDGDLSEWKRHFLGPFVVHNSGVKATQKNAVSLSWNNENLYIAFRSDDSKIIGSHQQHDSQIYKTDDLVEIFIDPDGDGLQYVEIGVNAFSTYYEMLIACALPACGGWKASMDFKVVGMETASKMTPEGFCVEIKIPFSALENSISTNFKTPTIGTKWKGNVFRIDFGKTTEYLALQHYSTSEFGFHQPSEFAVFEFVE